MGAKPLLIGELNPYGARPEYALYPLPAQASGDRLCRLVMGLTHAQYLETFDRVNLCTGKWSAPAARMAAAVILAEPPRTLVLLGAKVASAFGLQYAPLTVASAVHYPRRLIILPHPSGLSRFWGRPGAFAEAQALLVLEGVLS